MLPELHREYTKQILEGLINDNFIKEQIEIGSVANDYCELTDELTTMIQSKHEIAEVCGSKRKYTLLSNSYKPDFKKRFIGNVLFYQSHFGNLTSMHAMSKNPGELASVTEKELVEWFDFLNDVALENITIVPNKEIASDDVQIRDMFTGGNIRPLSKVFFSF